MLVKQFEQLHSNHKESLILISHQERIIQMADRIMVIKDGKIAKMGAKEQVFPGLMRHEGGCRCQGQPCV